MKAKEGILYIAGRYKDTTTWQTYMLELSGSNRPLGNMLPDNEVSKRLKLEMLRRIVALRSE